MILSQLAKTNNFKTQLYNKINRIAENEEIRYTPETHS